MRELKFRAWNSESKKLLYFDLFGLDDRYSYENAAVIPDDAPVMQYTGLKDKNGKEIYEGDILRVEMDGDLQVVYELVRWDDCGWEPWLSGVADRYFRITQCEVLGNIYENGDLLCDTSEH